MTSKQQQRLAPLKPSKILFLTGFVLLIISFVAGIIMHATVTALLTALGGLVLVVAGLVWAMIKLNFMTTHPVAPAINDDLLTPSFLEVLLYLVLPW